MLATDQQIWIADKEFWMKAKTRLKSSFKTLFYSSLQKENIQKELKVLLLSFPFLSVCLSFIPEVANPIILMMKEGGKFAREKSANCKDIKATISPLPTSSTPQIQSAFASPSKNSLEKKWKKQLTRYCVPFFHLSTFCLIFSVGVNQSGEKERNFCPLAVLGDRKLALLSNVDLAKWGSTSRPERHSPPWWLFGHTELPNKPKLFSFALIFLILTFKDTLARVTIVSSSQLFVDLKMLENVGSQAIFGPVVTRKRRVQMPRKDRRKIICWANNTIDESQTKGDRISHLRIHYIFHRKKREKLTKNVTFLCWK